MRVDFFGAIICLIPIESMTSSYARIAQAQPLSHIRTRLGQDVAQAGVWMRTKIVCCGGEYPFMRR